MHQRFLRWLRRHGLLKNEVDNEFSNEAPELSALEACAQGSLGLGNLVKKRSKPRSSNQDPDEGGFEQRSVVPNVAPATEHQHDLAMPSASPTLKPDPSHSASTTSPKIPADPTVASTILAALARESKQGPEPRSQDVGPRHGAPWRIDWATLLRRVHDVDALACPCGED